MVVICSKTVKYHEIVVRWRHLRFRSIQGFTCHVNNSRKATNYVSLDPLRLSGDCLRSLLDLCIRFFDAIKDFRRSLPERLP